MTLTMEGLAKKLGELRPGESVEYDAELGRLFDDPGLGKEAAARVRAFAKRQNCEFEESIGREFHRFRKLDHEGRPTG